MLVEPGRLVKHDGVDHPAGSLNGSGRAKYVGSAPSANDVDAPAFTLTASQLAAVVRTAVGLALDERDARQSPAVVPTWLTRNGLAEALGCSASQIDRLRQRGLPSERFGDSPRFELEKCMAWIRGQKANS